MSYMGCVVASVLRQTSLASSRAEVQAKAEEITATEKPLEKVAETQDGFVTTSEATELIGTTFD